MSAPPFHQRPLTFYAHDDPPRTSQDPEFREVQAAYTAHHPLAVAELKRIALRLAAERGAPGFTAEDVLDAAGGREGFEPHAIGVALGSLRAHHALCVVGRRKGRSPAGKGRWVNVFALNADALEMPA